MTLVAPPVCAVRFRPIKAYARGVTLVQPDGRRMLRIEARNAQVPIERKPPWIKVTARMGPQYTELHGLGPLDAGRLLRTIGVTRARLEEQVHAMGPVGILEELGGRWYRLAAQCAPRPLSASMSVVADVAEGFGPARRVLNFLTDRYLFTRRVGWFGSPAL